MLRSRTAYSPTRRTASARGTIWTTLTFPYDSFLCSLQADRLIDDHTQSLLSLPYLGFLDKSDPTYVATRKTLLSRGNPYYAVGKNFSGIG